MIDTNEDVCYKCNDTGYYQEENPGWYYGLWYYRCLCKIIRIIEGYEDVESTRIPDEELA